MKFLKTVAILLSRAEHDVSEKIAGTKDEQVMAIFIYTKMLAKNIKNDIYVFTASFKWLDL